MGMGGVIFFHVDGHNPMQYLDVDLPQGWYYQMIAPRTLVDAVMHGPFLTSDVAYQDARLRYGWK